MKPVVLTAFAASAAVLASAALLIPGSPGTRPAQAYETIWPETDHAYTQYRMTDLSGEADGRIESVTRNADGSLNSMQVVWYAPDGEAIGMVDHPAHFVSIDPDTNLVVAQIGWHDLHAGYRDAIQALGDDAAPEEPETASSVLTGTS